MNSPADTLCIVVEGVGDIVEKRYARALYSQYQKAMSRDRTLNVVFTDERKYWDHDQTPESVREKRKKFIRQIKSWARYIDKSTTAGRKAYNKLSTDIVLVATPDATHVATSLNWLNRPGACNHLFIEKPLDCSLRRARTLEYYGRHANVGIHPIDHYSARVIPLVNGLIITGILKELGGQLTRIEYFLLEDHETPHIGPIEKAARVETLKHGLVLDLFPHVLAVVRLFGRLESVDITQVRVGQYTFEDGSGNRVRTSIPKETFAQIAFTMKTLKGQSFEVESFLGKGICGSEIFPNQRGGLKRVVLHGVNKHKVVIDLGESGSVEVFDSKGEHDGDGPSLVEDPYESIIEEIVNHYLWGKPEKMAFVIGTRDAKTILACIHDVMTLVQNFLTAGIALPSYDIETSEDGRMSICPTLETVMNTVAPVEEEMLVSNLAEQFASNADLVFPRRDDLPN